MAEEERPREPEYEVTTQDQAPAETVPDVVEERLEAGRFASRPTESDDPGGPGDPDDPDIDEVKNLNR